MDSKRKMFSRISPNHRTRLWGMARWMLGWQDHCTPTRCSWERKTRNNRCYRQGSCWEATSRRRIKRTVVGFFFKVVACCARRCRYAALLISVGRSPRLETSEPKYAKDVANSLGWLLIIMGGGSCAISHGHKLGLLPFDAQPRACCLLVQHAKCPLQNDQQAAKQHDAVGVV